MRAWLMGEGGGVDGKDLGEDVDKYKGLGIVEDVSKGGGRATV